MHRGRTAVLLLQLASIQLASGAALRQAFAAQRPHPSPSSSLGRSLRGGSATCACAPGRRGLVTMADARSFMEGRTVLVDMDNTLVDWDAEFVARWQRLPQFKPEDVEMLRSRQHFEMEENFEPERQDAVKELMSGTGFYASLKPFPGAVEALKAMEAAGAHVLIVTSPHPLCAGSCSNEKFDWVERHLGKGWEGNLMIARDKTFVAGDLLVDDKPQVVGRAIPVWSQVHFAKPYNDLRAANVAGRLGAWSEWETVLGGLLKGFPARVKPSAK